MLKQARDNLSLTQEEVASGIGYEGTTMVSRAEGGHVFPSGVMLLRWLDFLNLDHVTALDIYESAASAVAPKKQGR